MFEGLFSIWQNIDQTSAINYYGIAQGFIVVDSLKIIQPSGHTDLDTRHTKFHRTFKLKTSKWERQINFLFLIFFPKKYSFLFLQNCRNVKSDDDSKKFLVFKKIVDSRFDFRILDKSRKNNRKIERETEVGLNRENKTRKDERKKTSGSRRIRQNNHQNIVNNSECFFKNGQHRPLFR